MTFFDLEDLKMKNMTFLLLFLLVAIPCPAAIITVDPNGSADHTTIQAAIDDANDFDTVIVADGTYTGAGNRDIDFKGKAITVRSQNGPETCIIDCENSNGHRGFGFHSAEDANSVLAGFTIKRGRFRNKGGGIKCTNSSPTIENCIITANKAYGLDYVGENAYGGGIYCTSNSHPTIVDCTISDNEVVGGVGEGGMDFGMDGEEGGGAYGGGIYGNVTVSNCTITGNTTQGGRGGPPGMDIGPPFTVVGGSGGKSFGGGLYGNSTIRNCTISNNTGRGGMGGDSTAPWGGLWRAQGGDSFGGGIYGTVTVCNSTISSNEAYSYEAESEPSPFQQLAGGGVYATGSSSIANCLVTGNSVRFDTTSWSIVFTTGGGIYSDSGSNVTISNNTIYNNTAQYSPNCPTCHGADGVKGQGSTVITDCIIWANGDDLDGCSATYSCIQDPDPGTGNIHDNPLFRAGPSGNYYLSQVSSGQASDSPCVDAGSDTSANLQMNHLTTRTSRAGDCGIVDMGFHYPDAIYNIADIDGDCAVRMGDFAILHAQWQSTPTIPSADIAPAGGDGLVNLTDAVIVAINWLQQVPSADLMVHLKLDETEGDTAYDSSGHGRDGTLIDFATDDSQWVSGKIDGALAFDGTDDYISINGYTGITGNAARACEAWIKTTETSGEIMWWGDNSTPGGEWRVRVYDFSGNGVLRVDVQGGYIYGITAVNTGQWVHIAAVLHEGTSSTQNIRLYINGVPEFLTFAGLHEIDTIPYDNVRIGSADNGLYFNGQIDDVRIYD